MVEEGYTPPKIALEIARREHDLRAQVARLEADVAAKDAALRRIRYGAWDTVTSDGGGILSREEMQEVARAALSDAGKGWLSPEVREQAARVIRERTIALHMNNGHSSQPNIEGCESFLCRESCAALDALEGK